MMAFGSTSVVLTYKASTLAPYSHFLNESYRRYALLHYLSNLGTVYSDLLIKLVHHVPFGIQVLRQHPFPLALGEYQLISIQSVLEDSVTTTFFHEVDDLFDQCR